MEKLRTNVHRPHLRRILTTPFAIAAAIGLVAAAAAPAHAQSCRADGELCRNNQACCGNGGRSGVCVKLPGSTFGVCCTRTIERCDGLDNDCNGLIDDGWALRSCSDGVACTIDACQSGGCLHTANDSVCDEGSLCSDEFCDAEDGCVSVPIDCDDQNPCTIDECDPDTGCTHRAKCDDDNLCTSDNCNPADGQCFHFGAGCLDFDPCTGPGTCNPATGQCAFPPIDCDDEDPCTADRCQGGTCVYDPVVCDDGNLCTDDFCEDGVGCTSTPKNCDDGNLCNGSEICSPMTGDCVPNPLIIVLPCIDNDVCTDNVCDPPTGACSYPPRNCDDGNACTIDSCDSALGCVHEEKICDFACLGDECDPATGGCGPILEAGTSCDDGDECTQDDTCFYGICSGTPCSVTETCCPGQGCVDLSMDSNNCGACGNVCDNSVCFQGACFDGCVIGAAAYLNGARNPANNCQLCDVSFSRTDWKPLSLLDNPGNPGAYVCHLGDCFNGFCLNGACSSFSGVSTGCPSSTCATSSCHPVSQQCVITPQNEGGACTPPLVSEACKSSTSGTCQSGQCVALPDNEGGSCDPGSIPAGANPACYSSNSGVCDSAGNCIPQRRTGASCESPIFAPCEVGTCKEVNGNFGCWFTSSNEPVCSSPNDYCGADGTCNTETNECVYPGPFEADLICGNTIGGARPELCCPGQVCACPPTLWGSIWCANYYCWWPEELEGPN